MAWFAAKAWTSQRAVGGYRHFQLVTQGGKGGQRWVELSAVLDPAHRERVLWRDLNDAKHWCSGWQQIVENDDDVVNHQHDVKSAEAVE